MKRWMRPCVAAVSTALVTGWAAAQSGPDFSLYLYSDDSWSVADPSAHTIPVCLNASSPLNCPTTGVALHYGHPGDWSTDLADIPYAQWIWDPTLIAAAAGAEDDVLKITTFFELPRCFFGFFGQILIAADDFAEVWVNGSLAGEVGSVIDPAQAAQSMQSLSLFELGAYLAEGTNVVTIRAVNGPGYFAGCTDCSYAENPAGVVFGAILGCLGP